ncbi:putative N-acetyltransferase [Mycobacterium pseudokansasii]|uniref:Putative N-acetyltransferase n=1 Tax=Mycobacterium pseudokansasii TaxID=2341080 RepID=A0A498QRD0_9MYCO|nr:putative N-acetyltransferase [Mycobacterium pseudokansasii]VAZ94265.1 putative N-acetyltransferase [Mycobacterium pseudokansasii]VBA49724.1 putative N-acetyltransferase [Mycobacterium pseudokansasii]
MAAVAARTFPLACPPSVAPEHIASFIDANLSATRFAEYLADPRRAILAARDQGRIVGYAMLVRGIDGDDSAELSKLYVIPDFHGTGVSSALMNAALSTAAAWGVHSLWLGVNRKNVRAQRFYLKSGFTVSGARTFPLGNHQEHDYVMTRAVTGRSAPPGATWPSGTSFDSHQPASPR